MSASDFSERMGRLPDEDLIRIAYSSDRDGFIEEAVNAAKLEIEKRNINQSDLVDIRSFNENENLIEENRRNASLSNFGVIMLLLFGICLGITIPSTTILYYRGYRRKSL